MTEKKPTSLAQALLNFQRDVESIQPNRVGKHGDFADLPHILSVIRPALAKNNLVLFQQVDHIEGKPALHTNLRLVNASGLAEISSVTPLSIQTEPIKRKDGSEIPLNPVQEWGKSITYTRRYAIQCILGISIGMEDFDPDLPDDDEDSDNTGAQADQLSPAQKKEQGIYGDPIDDETKKSWIDFIKPTPTKWRNELVKAFAMRFELTGQTPISEEITHVLHTVFLSEYIAQNPIPDQESGQ